MKYRIQLASNYQVVEIELDTQGPRIDKNSEEIQSAIELVNYLGETVQNEKKPAGKKPKAVKSENLATDKQKLRLDQMGIEYDEDITRQEAWKLIDKYTEK